MINKATPLKTLNTLAGIWRSHYWLRLTLLISNLALLIFFYRTQPSMAALGLPILLTVAQLFTEWQGKSSQALIQQSFEQSPDLIWLCDPEKNEIVIANDRVRLTLGAEEGAWAHKGPNLLLESIHAEDLFLINETFALLKTSPQMEEADREVRVRNSSGLWMWWSLKISKFGKSSLTRRPLFLIVAQDVSQKREIETNLKTESELSQMALDTGGFGYWSYTPHLHKFESDHSLQRVFSNHFSSKEEVAQFFEGSGLLETTTTELEFSKTNHQGLKEHFRCRTQSFGDLEENRIIGLVWNVTQEVHLRNNLVEERNLVEKALNALPQALVVRDAKGNIVFANTAFGNLFSCDPLAAKSWPESTILPNNISKKIQAMAEKVMSQQKPREFEEHFTNKTGDQTYLHLKLSPISFHDDRGAILVSLTNVTESEKARQKSRNLESLIESSPDLFGYLDLVNQPLYLNSAAQKNMGWSAQMGLDQFFDSPTLQRVIEEIIPTAIKKGEWEGELNLISLMAREHIPFFARFFVVRSNEGEPLFVGFTASDLRERKQAEAQILNSSRLATLGEMAGGIAHEVNNPLTIIIAKASQIQRFIKQSPPDLVRTEDAAKKIIGTSDRIGRIIKGLKSISRNGESDPFQSTPLKDLVTDVLELAQQRYVRSGIHLEISSIPDVAIDCRPSQIGQVLVNLLNNAHDAVATLDEKWVRLEIQTDFDRIRFTVTDSGRGIPAEVAKRIKEPFFTTKGVGKGTGLGLSISQRIAEAHNGRMDLDIKHQNTRFIFEIPIRQEDGNSETKGAA